MPKAKMIWLVSLIGGTLICAWPAGAGLLRGTPVTPSGSLRETSLVTPAKIAQTATTRFDYESSHSLFEENADEGDAVKYVVNRTGRVVRRPLLTRLATPTSTDRPGRGAMPSFGWQQKFKPLGEIKPLTALARLKKRGAESSASSPPAASSGSPDYSRAASDEVERTKAKKLANSILHDRPSETPKATTPAPRAGGSASPGVISQSYRSVADPNTTHFITGTPAEVQKWIREKQREDDRILKEREREAREERRLNELAAKNEKKQEESVAKTKARDVAKEDADMRAKWQEAATRAEKAEAELVRQKESSAKQGSKSALVPAAPKNIPPSDGGRAAVVGHAPTGVSSPAARTAAAAQTREVADVMQRQQQQAEINVRDRQYSDAVDQFSELRRQGRYDDAARALQQAYANSAYTTPDNIKQRMDVIEGLAKTLPSNTIAQNPVLSHLFGPQTQPQPQIQQAVPVQRLTTQQMEEQSRQEREALAAALQRKALAAVPVNATPATQLLAMANVTYSRPEVLMGSGPNVGQTSPMVRASSGSRSTSTTAKPLMPATYTPSSPTGSRSISASQVAAIKAKEGK